MRFEYLFNGVCCAVRLERSACMLRWTQLGANNEVATPVNWKNGEGVIIAVASATRTSSSRPEDVHALHPDRVAV